MSSHGKRYRSTKSDFQSEEFAALVDITMAEFMEQNPLRPCITLSVHDKPAEAFEKLIKHHILSAPVEDENGHFIGFLDCRDLVSSVVFDAQQKRNERHQMELVHDSEMGKTLKPSEYLEILLSKQNLAAAKWVDNPEKGTGAATLSVKYMCKRHRLIPVHLNDPLRKVMGLLTLNDIHRVPLMDRDTCVGIVSQSSIVQYLQNNRERLREVMAFTIEDLHLVSTPVVTCEAKDTALSAFETMNKMNMSGLAVVDEEGKLVANISSSDLKLFLQHPCDQHTLMNMSVMEFLCKVRNENAGPDIKAPVSVVRIDHTLAKVIGKLAATHYHRVFVTSFGGKVSGVISVSDVLKSLIYDAPPKRRQSDETTRSSECKMARNDDFKTLQVV